MQAGSHTHCIAQCPGARSARSSRPHRDSPIAFSSPTPVRLSAHIFKLELAFGDTAASFFWRHYDVLLGAAGPRKTKSQPPSCVRQGTHVLCLCSVVALVGGGAFASTGPLAKAMLSAVPVSCRLGSLDLRNVCGVSTITVLAMRGELRKTQTSKARNLVPSQRESFGSPC